MRLSKLSMSIFCLLPGISLAEVNWGGDVTLERRFSDNVALEEENERTDSSNLISGRFDIDAQERTYQVFGGYIYSREEWQNDSFDANSDLEGSIRANAFLIPGRLNWYAVHAQSVSRTISTLPDTPDNREERSVLSTGPTYIQRLNDRSTVTLRSAITKIDLEESSENNTKRMTHSVEYGHALSRLTSLSASVSSEESEFKENEASNYSRESANLSLSGTRPLFSYRVSLGLNTVKPDQGKNQRGKSANISLSRQHQKLRYELTFVKEITDTVFGFSDWLGGQITGTVDPETNIGDIQIIEREELRFVASYAMVPNQWQLGMRASYQNDKSQNSSSIDDTTRTIEFDSRYVIKTGLTSFAELELSKNDFEGLFTERSDELYRVSLGLDYALATRSNLRFDIEYRDLDSDASSASYDEFSSTLSYTYNFSR